MIKKEYKVSFLAEEDYADSKDYGAIIETTLLDNFVENGSMFDCDELVVTETMKDETGAADIVHKLLNRYATYGDFAFHYQKVDYIPGRSKNEENVEKWCKDNNLFLIGFETVRSPYKMNIIATSRWFGKIVSDWKMSYNIVTDNHGRGVIVCNEPYIHNGYLCVDVDFGDGDNTYKCWDLLAHIDNTTKFKLVKEKNIKEKSETMSFWDVVEKINWEWLCKNTSKPHVKGKEILKGLKLTDKRLNKLKETAQSYRRILENAVEEYSQKKYGNRHSWPHVSDDSFWDLTAHVVGLGENIYNDILAHPEKINTFVDNHSYKENFEYCFNFKGEDDGKTGCPEGVEED